MNGNRNFSPKKWNKKHKLNYYQFFFKIVFHYWARIMTLKRFSSFLNVYVYTYCNTNICRKKLNKTKSAKQQNLKIRTFNKFCINNNNKCFFFFFFIIFLLSLFLFPETSLFVLRSLDLIFQFSSRFFKGTINNKRWEKERAKKQKIIKMN